MDSRAKLRASGVVPLYRPRVAGREKLKLDVPTGYRVDTDADSRIGTDDHINVQPPSAGVDVSGSVGGAIGGSSGRGIGVGGGLGGGLRLGR